MLLVCRRSSPVDELRVFALPKSSQRQIACSPDRDGWTHTDVWAVKIAKEIYRSTERYDSEVLLPYQSLLLRRTFLCLMLDRLEDSLMKLDSAGWRKIYTCFFLNMFEIIRTFHLGLDIHIRSFSYSTRHLIKRDLGGTRRALKGEKGRIMKASTISGSCPE